MLPFEGGSGASLLSRREGIFGVMGKREDFLFFFGGGNFVVWGGGKWHRWGSCEERVWGLGEKRKGASILNVFWVGEKRKKFLLAWQD